MPDEWDLKPTLSSAVAQQGVADESGGVVHGGAVQADSELATVAFGGPTADFILYGVVNGAFAQGPPNANDFIENQNNPLPYWSFPSPQVSGGAIQCSWVADASSPSGYNLRFTINPGAASDEAYVEQVIEIGGSRAGWLAHAGRVGVNIVSNTGTVTYYVKLQYLTAALAATGSESTTSAGWSGTGFHPAFMAPTTPAPSDAAFLRVRVGVRNSGPASMSATVDITDVRLTVGGPVVLLPDQSDSSKAPGQIYQAAGVLSIRPQYPITSGSISLVGAVQVTNNNSLTATGAVINSGIITATIGANQNNYSPGGLSACAVLVMTATGATRTITGFDSTGFTEGQEFTLVNDNTNSIVLAHSSASSSSGNKIGCPSATDMTVPTNGSVTVRYLPNEFSGTPFRVEQVNATGGSVTFAAPALTLGTANTAGVATTVLATDSTILAFDATSPTTQALGDAAAVGAATVAARRDHKHAMPSATATASGLTLAATSRFLGRITAGSGAVEELTAANAKTIAGYYTSGDSPSFAAITGTGAMDLSGGSAGQIAFPATQNASAGVNTLDDYEEGTFTPALAYATVGSSTWAITSQLGWYTKIGNVVHYTLFYSGVPTNGTGAGALNVTGLPFTAKGTTNEHHANAVEIQGYTKANFTAVAMRILQGTTTAEFRASGSAQSTAQLVVGDIPTGGTVIVRSSGIYFTAS